MDEERVLRLIDGGKPDAEPYVGLHRGNFGMPVVVRGTIDRDGSIEPVYVEEITELLLEEDET